MDGRLQPARLERSRRDGGVQSGVMSVREENAQWMVGNGRYELNRRDFLRGAAVFALLSTTRYALTTAHCQSADAWPQFRGNWSNTGVSPSGLPAELKLLWT